LVGRTAAVLTAIDGRIGCHAAALEAVLPLRAVAGHDAGATGALATLEGDAGFALGTAGFVAAVDLVDQRGTHSGDASFSLGAVTVDLAALHGTVVALLDFDDVRCACRDVITACQSDDKQSEDDGKVSHFFDPQPGDTGMSALAQLLKAEDGDEIEATSSSYALLRTAVQLKKAGKSQARR
jgi:hypothetical protein